MKISYDKIKSIFPEFNISQLTEELFWRTAKHNKIIVQQEPLLVDGYYTRKKGKHMILIDSRLTGLKWLHTAWHEVFHFFLDVPPGKGDVRFNRSRLQIRTKQELTVDALAVIAIIPYPDLEKYQAEDLTDNYELSRAVGDRVVVKAEYRY